ncbi:MULTISPECIES: FAD-binding oxidoreductase [Neisseria]|uniref:FAD linked oxidase C-terminal domain protein n=1 Tax=Neisseria musculi TaxID=1815583 RepID=A0A7H1M9F8_9NEIS|nr:MULTISPECIES: FAD-binding oxidoreductase [Neisseria]MBF0804611.1 FAD-binding oxidoreductase [Neisseria sp. 19428wB4_WF04]QNT58273.1 FAD linked oxidase, C-terminal domain protein [Neisseria musculi]TFU40371.1 FAD-binding oxidoreductase [Neisseria sp. WF04]
MSSHIKAALRQFLNADEIIESAPQWLTDQRCRYSGRADALVQPKSINAVQQLMRFCFQNKIPVTPQGGNTGLCGAAVPDGGVLLNLSKLNRIRSINLADNAITVDAGIVLQAVQQAAAAAGRLFPLSLASEGSCQIGGNIACNAGGLNVLRYGTMRDLVLGLEVVLPNGELVQHLHPLHKNTTGYDLRHLFIGSEGTLGVVTGAVLKLFALPKTVETVWVGVDSIEQAVALLTLVQGVFAERLCSFELAGRFALALSSDFSRIGKPVDASWHILLELADSMESGSLGEELAELLLAHGFGNAVAAQSETERRVLWTLRENISAAQRNLGASIKHDIAVPIARAAEFVAGCESALQTAFPGIKIVVFGHLGDGSLHYNTFLPGVSDNGVYEYEDAVNTVVYENVLACGGTVAAEHGIGMVKKQWLPSVRSAAEIALMRAVKAELDPHNIMNPGKLLP